MTTSALHLPGLEPAAPNATALERAARLQLQELRESGRLQVSHAILEQLVIDLARVIGESCARGRAAAAALAAKQLMDALEALPDAGDSELQALVDRLQSV